jgi:hypothetical protein
MISKKRLRNKKEIKSKSREIESLNRSNTSGLLSKKMQSRKSIKTNFHNQETAEDSDMKCCECWESDARTTKEDGGIECVSYRNWLQEFRSSYKNKCVDCGRKLLRGKNNMQKGI